MLRRSRSDDSQDTLDDVDVSAGVERRSRLKVDHDRLESMLTEFDADTQEEIAASLSVDYDDHRAAPEREDRRKGDRQSMEHLRAEYKWSVAPDVSGPAVVGTEKKMFGRDGVMTPVRMFGLIVAVLAGSAAFWVSMQSRTTPPPAPIVEAAVTAPQVVLEPKVKVLVARNDIAVGERLSADLVEWVEWPESSLRADYVNFEAAPNALEEMNANVARMEILAGEPIREVKLVQTEHGFLSVILEEGMRAVSVPVSAHAAAGGFIRPNDHVDVVLTRSGPEGQTSETVLTNATVLAINGRLGERAVRDGGEPEINDPTQDVFSKEAIATLALDPDRAEVLINAAKTGSLALVLRSIEDFSKPDETVRAGINQSIRMTSPFWTSGSGVRGPR